MKAKVARGKNTGSKTTSTENVSAAVASTGSSRTIRTTGRNGSSEGLNDSSSTYILPRGKGYLSKGAQGARYADKSVAIGNSSGGKFDGLAKGRNPTAMSNVGMISSGSSKILNKRMEFNRL